MSGSPKSRRIKSIRAPSRIRSASSPSPASRTAYPCKLSVVRNIPRKSTSSSTTSIVFTAISRRVSHSGRKGGYARTQPCRRLRSRLRSVQLSTRRRPRRSRGPRARGEARRSPSTRRSIAAYPSATNNHASRADSSRTSPTFLSVRSTPLMNSASLRDSHTRTRVWPGASVVPWRASIPRTRYGAKCHICAPVFHSCVNKQAP